jgi:hypothetical protein
MSSDNNLYMIDDDGQIVLMPNVNQNLQNNTNNSQVSQRTTVLNPSLSVAYSQLNPVVNQNGPSMQSTVRQGSVNRVRNVGGIRYTQNKPPMQHTSQNDFPINVGQNDFPINVGQQVYQRPQVQQVHVQQQVQTPVYQRPQVQQQVQAPVLNGRTLNNQRQGSSAQVEESLSYNNWKKMNMSLNQMVNDSNPQRNLNQYARNLNQYAPYLDEQTELDDSVQNLNMEEPQQEFIPNSNRARYGTFISNNTSHNTRNHGSIRSKNIPSYLAIRKANNSESIYL